MNYQENFLKTNITEELETDFRSCYKRKIYLEKGEPKDITDLIARMMSGEPTVYKRGGNQCDKDRCRSIVDIYRVCLTYFPETKFKNVVSILSEINKSYPGYGYCHVIKKYRVGTYGYMNYSVNSWNRFKDIVKNATNKFNTTGLPAKSN